MFSMAHQPAPSRCVVICSRRARRRAALGKLVHFTMSEEPLDRPGPGAVFAFDVSDAEREALRDELRRAAAQETGFASRRRLEELLTDAAAVALVLERNGLQPSVAAAPHWFARQPTLLPPARRPSWRRSKSGSRPRPASCAS
jgi:hypothetical protein